MKIVNIILGLGTAIILGALINLGIRAFYPEPVAPDYGMMVKPMIAYPAPCAAGDKTCVAQLNVYNAEQQAQQDAFNQKQKEYQDAMRIYNRDVFIIANIVGIVVFIVGFWFVFTTAIATQSVPIGIMIAGLWSIIYGYGRGWDSIDDRLKFFVGLVVAALVVGGSVWLIQRYHDKKTA
jgi:heme/copper-type cytochrome/quinol oxidase subunit 4